MAVGRYAKALAKPGKGEELSRILIDVARALEDVPGCELYVINRAVDDPDTVWVTEIWGSQDELDASLQAEGARERIGPTLERMFSWANHGIAANFLSALSPVPVEARVYIEPAEMLEFGLMLTPAARLDHSYLPNDFTIHLYKTPPWEPTSTRKP